MNIFALIKESVPLVEVINRYTKLEKSGTYLRGNCPLCKEEEGSSFTVSACEKRFYCFKCHQGGDVVAFLSKKENISPREAVEILMVQGGLFSENSMTVL